MISQHGDKTNKQTTPPQNPNTQQQEAICNIFTHAAKAKFDMIKGAHSTPQLKLSETCLLAWFLSPEFQKG